MPLTRRQMAGWGLADMGINVFVVVKQLLVFTWLTAFLGVPPGIAGGITFAVLAFDVVTDPLVGYLSDRLPTRWGRRAPWIFIGALILTAGILGMFAVPAAMGWRGSGLWVAGFFALATVGFTFVAVPYGAMAGEMTQDARERSAMTAWRMVFASLGLLVAGAAIPALAGSSRAGYFGAVATVAPLVVVAVWGALWCTRDAPRLAAPVLGSPGEVARLVLANRPFVALVCLYGLLTLAVALVAAGLQLAALTLIRPEGAGMLAGAVAVLGVFSVLFACFILGAVASQWVWVRASARMGKLPALLLCLALYVAVLGAIFALLPAAPLGLLAGMFVLAGVGNGGYQQIPWAMYPDLMDVTRAESGQAVEGAFSALWLFGQKVANALAPLILGLVLSAAGWREGTGGATDQSPEALGALRLSLTLLPAALIALAMLGLATIYRRALPRGGVHA